MPGTSTPIYPQTIRNYAAQILPADGTGKKTLVTGGTNGSRVDAVNVASTETTARDLQIWLSNGTADFLLATISVPANSGNNNAAPSVDVLRHYVLPGLAVDASGNRILYVESGWSLKASATSALTAGKELVLVASAGGDY